MTCSILLLWSECHGFKTLSHPSHLFDIRLLYVGVTQNPITSRCRVGSHMGTNASLRSASLTHHCGRLGQMLRNIVKIMAAFWQHWPTLIIMVSLPVNRFIYGSEVIYSTVFRAYLQMLAPVFWLSCCLWQNGFCFM